MTQGKFSPLLTFFQLDREVPSTAALLPAKLCLLVLGSSEKRDEAAVFDRLAPGGSDPRGEESGC